MENIDRQTDGRTDGKAISFSDSLSSQILPIWTWSAAAYIGMYILPQISLPKKFLYGISSPVAMTDTISCHSVPGVKIYTPPPKKMKFLTTPLCGPYKFSPCMVVCGMTSMRVTGLWCL